MPVRVVRILTCLMAALTIIVCRSSFGQPAAGPAIWPSSHPSYAAIDKHALAAPTSAEASVAELAAYLVRPAKNDAEKARAFYRWTTDRIAYDVETYLARKKFIDASPQKILKDKLGTCDGYAMLIKALCDEAKIENMLIPGHVRGVAPDPTGQLPPNHMWNAVKLDGRWYLLDATWGAGNLNVRTKKWEKNYRDYFFLTPPDHLIFTHFPANPAQQNLQAPVTAQQFHKLGQVHLGMVIHGIPARKIIDSLEAPNFRGLAGFDWDGKFPLRILEAPHERHLKKGQTYRFRFEAASCPKMVLAIGNASQEFRRVGQAFETTITPSQTGKLQLGAQFDGKQGFFMFLEYEVE